VPLLLILRLSFFFRIQEITLWSVHRNSRSILWYQQLKRHFSLCGYLAGGERL
jgi:hypothetical protein